MNYIYDIYLNFNKELYDFFDWDKKDKITHIKKIPVIKLNHQKYIECLTNKIKIDEMTLNSILNKTETWNLNKNKMNCILVSDESDVLAIEFNSNGCSIKKSFLEIDEELEVLEFISTLKEKKFNFTILKKNNTLLKTRSQLKEKKFINSELNNIETDKLSYLFFECFNEKEKNPKIILEKLKKISQNSQTYKKLYNILKLTSTQKN